MALPDDQLMKMEDIRHENIAVDRRSPRFYY
jgi:hypothetical protein